MEQTQKQKFRAEIEKESKQIFMSLARLYVNFGPTAAVQIYDTLILSLQELRQQALDEAERFKNAAAQVSSVQLETDSNGNCSVTRIEVPGSL